MLRKTHFIFSSVELPNFYAFIIFLDPSCIHVENGCFFAEPSCKRYNNALNDDYKGWCIPLYIFDLQQHKLYFFNVTCMLLGKKPVIMTTGHVM